MSEKKLFITGMGGMTGRVLAQAAVREGYQVAGTINTSSPLELKPLIARNSITVYQTDLRDSHQTRQAIIDSQPDIVVHLAGRVLGRLDVQNSDPVVLNENLAILRNVLAGVRALPTSPRFLLSSGCLVYDKLTSPEFVIETNPQNLPVVKETEQPYRASRIAQERLISEQTDLDYIIARPTQITGPGKIPGVIEHYIAKEITAVQKGKSNQVNVMNKRGEVDLLDVRDVAEAYLKLIKRGQSQDVYHISSGSPTTVEQLAQVFMTVVGIDIHQVPVHSTHAEETTYFRFSPSKLNQLGWQPHHSLDEALSSYWEYAKYGILDF